MRSFCVFGFTTLWIGRQLSFLAVLILVPQGSDAYVLRPSPPGSALVLNLNLPTALALTLGYGTQSFSSLAETAAAQWNAVGIGPQRDHRFFFKTASLVQGDACSMDAVSEVRFSTHVCGLLWGDAIGITMFRGTGPFVTEADVLFNSAVPFNAYPGSIVEAAQGGPLFDFFRLALHELGHAVGLRHPNDFDETVVALMNAGNQALGGLQSWVDNLQPDDIAGAHAINWPPAAAFLTVNDTVFRAGETLKIGVVARNPVGNPTRVLFVGAILLDGETLVFFSAPGVLAGTVPPGQPWIPLQWLPQGAVVDIPSFAVFTFPATGVAAGMYLLFAAVTGEDGEPIFIDVAPITFAP